MRCDHVPVDEYAAQLVRDGWPPDQVVEAVANAERSLSFRVEEHAELDDGRLLLLTDDRGWGQSGPADPWAFLTREDLERTALAVVLPDDAEQTGEEHCWDVLAERLRDHGVAVTVDELRAVPYEVELSARLQARLNRE